MQIQTQISKASISVVGQGGPKYKYQINLHRNANSNPNTNIRSKVPTPRISLSAPVTLPHSFVKVTQQNSLLLHCLISVFQVSESHTGQKNRSFRQKFWVSANKLYFDNQTIPQLWKWSLPKGVSDLSANFSMLEDILVTKLRAFNFIRLNRFCAKLQNKSTEVFCIALRHCE